MIDIKMYVENMGMQLLSCIVMEEKNLNEYVYIIEKGIFGLIFI